MTKEELALIGSAVAVSTALAGLLWAITWPHFKKRVKKTLQEDGAEFREFVFKALTEDQARFQEWNRQYWARAIAGWDSGTHQATETRRELAELAEEFRKFHETFGARVEQFGSFAVAITHLENTMKELNLTLRTIRDDSTQMKQDIAILKERREQQRAQQQRGNR